MAEKVPDPAQFAPFVLETHGLVDFGVLDVAGRWHSFSVMPEPLAPTGRAGRYDPDNGFDTRDEALADMRTIIAEYNRIRSGAPAELTIAKCAEIPAAETPMIDFAVDELLHDACDEIVRLCERVDQLRIALTDALDCPSVWCMCDSHVLLRDTEGDTDPSGWQ